jgi:cytochrome c oxidase subunit II
MTGLFGFNWGLPENISDMGASIDSMMNVIHWFMLVLFVGWGSFMAYCIFRFRARPGHKAIYEPIHASWSKWLEIGIVVFEAVLLIGFSMPVWASFKRELPKPEVATEVRIIGMQFKWNFWYPGFDGKFGRTSPKYAKGSNFIGLDLDNDPAAADDYVDQGELVFPVEKPVLATIMSQDVIHSIGVAALRLKQDAIPGMSIPIWWKATKTGSYDIACSQLCGNGHTTMAAKLRPVSNEEYEAWKKEWWTPAPEAAAPAPTEVASPAPSAAITPAPAAPAATPTAAPATSAAPAASATPGTH